MCVAIWIYHQNVSKTILTAVVIHCCCLAVGICPHGQYTLGTFQVRGWGLKSVSKRMNVLACTTVVQVVRPLKVIMAKL